MANWFENLPDKCPPNDAFAPSGHTFYRLINGQTATSDDYISQRAEFPWKKFVGIDECIERAVSIFSLEADCEKMLKFARHRHKRVYAITLNEKDGLVKQTFKPSHHSWWRTSTFKIDND